MSSNQIEQIIHQYGKSRNLFIITASELYHVKDGLKQHIPSLADETCDPQLKMVFYKMLTSLEVEMHRLQCMTLRLHEEILSSTKAAALCLNLEDYLVASSDNSHSLNKDWLLIGYLLRMEAIQFQALQVLLLVAGKLEDEQLSLLIMQTVQDSKHTTAQLEQLLKHRLN